MDTFFTVQLLRRAVMGSLFTVQLLRIDVMGTVYSTLDKKRCNGQSV